MKAANIVNKFLEADVDDPESFMQYFEPRYVIASSFGTYWGGMGEPAENVHGSLYSQHFGPWHHDPSRAFTFTLKEAEGHLRKLRLLGMQQNFYTKEQAERAVYLQLADQEVLGNHPR